MASRATLDQPKIAISVQSPDIAAAARLAGEDMCSDRRSSSAEVRAIFKLGHDVKRNPHANTGMRWMPSKCVLMFEKNRQPAHAPDF